MFSNSFGVHIFALEKNCGIFEWAALPLLARKTTIPRLGTKPRVTIVSNMKCRNETFKINHTLIPLI